MQSLNLMRASVGLMALLWASTALAETQTLSSHVTAVTVYPGVAEVTRQVQFVATAPGLVDLVIPDLPMNAEVAGMQFASDAGVSIQSFALRFDRVPPADAPEPPAVVAARDALTAAETALAEVTAARDAVLARADAAAAEVTFLTAVRLDGATLTPEAVQAMAATIGAQVLAARQAALAAGTEALTFAPRLTKAETARDNAAAALEALMAEPVDHAALTLSVQVAAAGPVTLDITHFVDDANWRPAYDLALDDRAQPPVLTLSRGALVSQATGEDWQGVDLTLSTARPTEQSSPSDLYPWLRVIGDPMPEMAEAKVMGDMAGGAVMASPAPAEVASMAADFSGIAVTYHLAAKASVASGVEDLRLGLDSLTFAPEVVAEAVPSRDLTGFVVARWVNSGAEILLPGEATLRRDGTLVGGTMLEMLAPGAKATTGFGAIEGLKLTRTVPDRSTGDHGVFTTSTEQHEVALLKVENLTAQAWPVRLLDQVPYSEQDDLQITFTARPAPDEVDIDGGRGLLGWNFDLAPGAVQEVTLDSQLSWPAGKVLQ